jgi:hypothetical protein
VHDIEREQWIHERAVLAVAHTDLEEEIEDIARELATVMPSGLLQF